MLFFAAPRYMISKIRNVRDEVIRKNDESTAVEYTHGAITDKIQPLEHISFVFRDSVSALIGLHANIIAIVVWSKRHIIGEEEIQMLGRIYRLNTFKNPLYFYIENSVLEYS